MTLAADGPDCLPLRTFRDDDLLDPGSDPPIALIGALSALHDKERIVARILLRSLGPDWSAAHMNKAVRNPANERLAELASLVVAAVYVCHSRVRHIAIGPND